jgi:hypothetical protein
MVFILPIRLVLVLTTATLLTTPLTTPMIFIPLPALPTPTT